MIITLGWGSDLAFEKSYSDRLIVVAHGESTVRQGKDGPALRPDLDETEYKSMRRRFFHLKPYGPNATDPFPLGESSAIFVPRESRVGGASCVWKFFVDYEMEDDDFQPKSAQINLIAIQDDKVHWHIEALLNDVMIDLGALKTINWYPKESSIIGLTAMPRRERHEHRYVTLGVDTLEGPNAVQALCPVLRKDEAEVSQLLGTWRADKLPPKEQCALLSKMARKHGNQLQWWANDPSPPLHLL